MKQQADDKTLHPTRCVEHSPVGIIGCTSADYINERKAAVGYGRLNIPHEFSLLREGLSAASYASLSLHTLVFLVQYIQGMLLRTVYHDREVT